MGIWNSNSLSSSINRAVLFQEGEEKFKNQILRNWKNPKKERKKENPKEEIQKRLHTRKEAS